MIKRGAQPQLLDQEEATAEQQQTQEEETSKFEHLKSMKRMEDRT